MNPIASFLNGSGLGAVILIVVLIALTATKATDNER